jgi:hypothetical protein
MVFLFVYVDNSLSKFCVFVFPKFLNKAIAEFSVGLLFLFFVLRPTYLASFDMPFVSGRAGACVEFHRFKLHTRCIETYKTSGLKLKRLLRAIFGEGCSFPCPASVNKNLVIVNVTHYVGVKRVVSVDRTASWKGKRFLLAFVCHQYHEISVKRE